MANSWVRVGIIALAVVSAAAGPMLVHAAPPAKKAPPTAAAASTRSAAEIKTELAATQMQLVSVMKSPKDLFDPAKRLEMASNAVPPLRKMLDLFKELSTVDKNFAEDYPQIRKQLEPTLAILHEQQTLDELEAATASKDANEAAYAKGTLLLVRYVDANKDPVGQNKVLDELEQLAKTNPGNEDLVTTFVVARMSNVAAGADQKARLDKAFMSLNSPMAKQMQQMMVSEAKRKERENKPLAFSAKTLDGKTFNSTSLKGKVVLVDFWATWCGPCVAELPRVKETYQKYHDKGLEIVGVSCDNSASDLTDFLKKNPEMTWVQLFDDKEAGWHPLAKEYGIDAIPTMYLIDRKGVLRSVEAREQMEELIPKLLAEK